MSRSYLKPPQTLEQLLCFFLLDDEKDEKVGDFEEAYRIKVDSKRIRIARMWYGLQIIKAIPVFLKNIIFWSFMMFKNYLKTAVRNIKRFKGFSFINITGLAIGMAVCLLILMYVKDELSYDRYHKYADRIYRIESTVKMEDRELTINGASAPMAQAMINDFPEVEDAVRFREEGSLKLQYKDKIFREDKVVFSEPRLFNIFSLTLLKGDPEKSLESPNCMILSRKTAAKYFGNEDPVGKTMKGSDSQDFLVTGVFEDIPLNSHFHFDVIASLSSLPESRAPVWLTLNFPTYLLLDANADYKVVEGKFPLIIDKYLAPNIKKFMGKTLEELYQERGLEQSFSLRRLTDVHLHSNILGDFEANSDYRYITIFSAIALFVLIIAAVNFMNLSTARSFGRAKEVGLRKVLGSQRRNLVRQFVLESVVMSAISLSIAIGLVGIGLPLFNLLSGKGLDFSILGSGFMLIGIFSVTLLSGILAGSYPALFISSYQPVHVLKGRYELRGKSVVIRRVLVVFQFSASIILLVGTLVIFNQLRFIQNKNLGFNKEQILVLDNKASQFDTANSFKNEMLNYSQVLNGTVTGFLPVPSSRTFLPIYPEGTDDNEKWPPINMGSVDIDYIKTLQISIVAGRDFSRDMATDSEAAVINRSAAEYFGWDEPLGKRIFCVTGVRGEHDSYTVIGIVEDFHFDSLRDSIKPLVLTLGESASRISFRVQTDDLAGTLEVFKRKWKEFFPNEPFAYAFLDEKFNDIYKSELRIGKIIGVFAALAVFIGCLGLYGLASFTAERRTKEIGIRKVLGASISRIVMMLLNEYILLVAAANLLAWPVAYFVMKNWLQNFAYRTPIHVFIFILSGVLTIVLALVTVAYQAMKAALADPVKTLHYE